MQNLHSPGETVQLTAPTGGVVSGSFYKIGSFFGAAIASVAQTLPFQLRRLGKFQVTKAASQAWTEGAVVYWDDSAKNFTTTSSGNTKVGLAAEAVGSGAGETTGYVVLVPSI